MAQIKLIFPFLLLLFLTAAAAPAYCFSFSQYRSVLSLSHSLLTRVSNLRASRGDTAGSTRAKLLADKLERASGLGFWRLACSFGWDYARNYAWRRDFNPREVYGVVSELNELARILGEFARANSDGERVAWVSRNYGNVLRVSKSAISRLLDVFRRQGPLKEVVEVVRKEVVEGGLLRDCLELGSNDLKGLVQIMKDRASHSFTDSDRNRNTDL